jgi:serine/alanine adding enzyme
MLVIKDYREIERNCWNEFVAGHTHGNIFHTPEMFDLYNSDEKNEPVFLSALTPEKKICGLMIAYIIREYKGVAGELTSRAIIWGGPLVVDQDPEVTASLLKEFNKICRKKAIYSQFRNLWDVSSLRSIFNQKGYNYEEHLNFIFDLNKGEEFLWSRIHPTRRKQINRGIKREVKTAVVGSLIMADLESCYKILKAVYISAKLPIPDPGFFKSAVQILCPAGYLKAILATHHGEIIGFRFFLSYKGLLYDWYAGSLHEHHDKYPNDILPWELMKWGMVNGFSTFDFGGAGKPGVTYGVRDYKLKFGGDMVNFGRFERIHKPFMMILARTGFNIWKFVKNKL